ncbi:hypothetical protein PPERSA_02440 [Pseudocohnilembus persalinus]|uniref:Uncharacterized protein n=1 Tax=Pseudocohnilembus persalinus TaxID=266149 RepID=A0A0V0QAV7_PSEPJ|nr:hypothetical protein PPERSA_02440 [Pseudocohnilembus persalinus]|eukprot:KRW99328.1 hypothetical protein PPERSA_02440 [Pseudocohnilembus persalinus]
MFQKNFYQNNFLFANQKNKQIQNQRNLKKIKQNNTIQPLHSSKQTKRPKKKMAKKYENLEFENCYPMEDIIAFHKLAVKQRDPKPQVSQGPNIQTLQIGNNIQNKITHHGNIIDLDITINIGNNNYVVSNSFEFFNSHTHPLESFLFPVSNQSKSQSSQKKKQPKFKQIQVQESSEAPSLRSSNSPLKKPTKRIRKPGKYYDYENYQYRYYSPKHSQTEENSLQENQNQKLKEKEKEKKNKKKSLFNTQKLSKINKQHRKYPPLQRINPNNFQQIEDYENNSTNTSQQESLNQTSQALQEEEYDEDEGTLLESQQI